MMNGDADLPHRSSSPLKRRASSMDPEEDLKVKGGSATTNGLRAMSVDPPEGDVGGASEYQTQKPPPPIHEQIKIIETLLEASKQAPLKEGDKAYLVSRVWVDKALALKSDPKRAKLDENDIKSLGPVDNSDIIEDVIKDSTGVELVRLKPGTGLESFELFPEDAWNMVAEWYGIKDDQKPIIRTAISDAPDAQSEGEIVYELHPPIFKIHRLWSMISPFPIEQSLKADNPPPLTLVRSRKSPAHGFIKDAKTLAGIPLERRVRLHAFTTAPESTEEPSNNGSALTPPDSPTHEGSNGTQNSWSRLLVDTPTFSSVRNLSMTLDVHDTTTNPKFNGKSSLQLHNLVTDQTIVLDEAIDNWYVSTYTEKEASRRGKSNKGAISALSSRTNSRRSSPVPQGPLIRGRGQRKRLGKSLGAVGLHNLGNTCYMNSALQCVRSVEELTKYFLTDSYADEINKTNPLGYNGRVALAYFGLLKDIYEEGRGSVTPRDFKSTVGRCRATFQGWGQQDSQEFLGFLLDGLQEDLSRIKNKPYIEKPDSTDDMINDPEAIRRMAEQVWDITRRRDDSVIADLFTGMYKSTLKCPECGKISITFDPFNNLTLPLPIEETWTSPVKFFPLNDVPVYIDAELPKHSAIESLKQFISIRTGVPADRLMGAEEFKEKFFKIYDNNQDVSEEIQGSDFATFHEIEAVPTNWPIKGKRLRRSMLDVDAPADASEWEDPAYERMVVPVFHRRPAEYGRNQGPAPPHFIVLDREEASDLDIIKRKILQKLATFTTWPTLKQAADGDNDSDGVTAATSDVDSGDSKVAARSVDGEEDMVDVTMKDASEKPSEQPNLPHQPGILKQFSTKQPAFMEPGSFLSPDLQNLFELHYFFDGNDGSVPTGWGALDNSNRTLPKMADRLPQSSEDEESPESWGSTGSGNEESSNEEASEVVSSEPTNTRMADESSEEDASAIRFARRPNPAKFKKGGKKFKDHKTYGKKGNKRREKQMRAAQKEARPTVKPQPMPPAQADGGPLIRLGEGIVCDWNDEAYDTVFGGSPVNKDDIRGVQTFADPETLGDSALKISRRRRQTRRTRGISLDECLDEFERAEVLSEQDMWYCPRCKEHRRASKKFDLWKSPDILVAHLKRFSSSGYRRDKLDVLVDFPIEGLDLTSRVIEKEDGKEEIYDLIAVDDHYGGLGGGHYTAYAKNFMDGRWYNYNDSSVSQVSDPSTVITSAAYLLFYRRRSSKPLGGPRFAEIFEKFDSPNDADEDSPVENNDDQRSDGSFGRGSGATTTIRSLQGPDDDLPGYSQSGIRSSVEDEGVEMTDHFASRNSNPIQQEWSFANSSTINAGAPSDGGSDTVQVSSEDDRGAFDQDVEMNSIAGDVSDGEAPHSLVAVPAKTAGRRDSEEVAEIHVEGDKEARLD